MLFLELLFTLHIAFSYRVVDGKLKGANDGDEDAKSDQKGLHRLDGGALESNANDNERDTAPKIEDELDEALDQLLTAVVATSGSSYFCYCFCHWDIVVGCICRSHRDYCIYILFS